MDVRRPDRPPRLRALLTVVATVAAVIAVPATSLGAQTEEPRIRTAPASGYDAGYGLFGEDPYLGVEVWLTGWEPTDTVTYCLSALDPGDPDDPDDPGFPSITDLCGVRTSGSEVGPMGSIDFVWTPERINWVDGLQRWVDCDLERCGWVAASWPDGQRLSWWPVEFAPRPPAPTSPPTITLAPSTAPDFLQVEVQGLRPGATAAVSQCRLAPTGPEQCRWWNQLARADATGAVRGWSFYVQDQVTPLGGEPFDCTQPYSCTMVVYDADNPWIMPASVPIPRQFPRVVPGAGTVAEGDVGTTVVDVPVTLDTAVPVEVTVRWTTVYVPGAPAGQTEPDIDYLPATGTVVFPPGTTTATVPITVVGDDALEPDEYIVVMFGLPTNARMGGYWGLGFGWIVDDD